MRKWIDLTNKVFGKLTVIKVRIDGKSTYLGSFLTQKEASICYQNKKKEIMQTI